MTIRAHVSAQRLDARMRFERRTETPDGSGGVAVTWVPMAGGRKFHVAVDGAKASSPEPVIDGMIRSVGDYTVWMRAELFQRLGLRLKDRGVWKVGGEDQFLDIKDAPNQQLRGNLMALRCSVGKRKG